MAPIRLPVAVECLRFTKGSTEELPNWDPLYTSHISRKVVEYLVAMFRRFWIMLIKPSLLTTSGKKPEELMGLGGAGYKSSLRDIR